MAAVKGIFGLGKKSSLGAKGGIKHDTGKNMASHGAYPMASAGKNSGTARGGDPKGCKPNKGC